MNVQALKTLYVALGGKLTDTHSDINGGSTVGNYTLISDVILAIAKKASTIPAPTTLPPPPQPTSEPPAS